MRKPNVNEDQFCSHVRIIILKLREKLDRCGEEKNVIDKFVNIQQHDDIIIVKCKKSSEMFGFS